MNEMSVHFFLNLGTKSIGCRYRWSGEVPIQLGTGIFQSIPTNVIGETHEIQ